MELLQMILLSSPILIFSIYLTIKNHTLYEEVKFYKRVIENISKENDCHIIIENHKDCFLFTTYSHEEFNNKNK